MHVPITRPALRLPLAGHLLPPIDGLVANEEAHRYCFRGDWLPFSVTGIVSDLSPAARKQIERTKDGPDGWEVRGTSIHAILEQHLRGIANEGLTGVVIDERWAQWAEPLLDHWLWRDCTVLAVEMQLCDPLKRVGGSFFLSGAHGAGEHGAGRSEDGHQCRGLEEQETSRSAAGCLREHVGDVVSADHGGQVRDAGFGAWGV